MKKLKKGMIFQNVVDPDFRIKIDYVSSYEEGVCIITLFQKEEKKFSPDSPFEYELKGEELILKLGELRFRTRLVA